MIEVDDGLIDELTTLRDWIRWGATQFNREKVFYGHGTDNGWDEAAQIVLWVVQAPWQKLDHIADAKLSKAERHQVLAAFVQRVNERLPVPYITGEAFFAGLPFEVTRDTLIPRSPIAELIEQHFQPWLTQPPTNILDLCTGCGCIGIACAMHFPEAQVTLSDISLAALTVAQRNVERFDLEHQVELVESDLFANIERRFDLIVSNPPYVDAEDMASLPEEFRVEPELALASGFDGLDFTRRLLLEADQFLSDDGLLIVEVGNSSIALEQAFPHVPFLWFEFERGGQGVFALSRRQLIAHKNDFMKSSTPLAE